MIVLNDKYFNKIKSIITERGGEIVSDKILNSTTKIKVRCKNDHEFEITPNRIQQKRWCKECRRTSFKMINDFVSNKGGKVYGKHNNMQSKLQFTCELGHEWIATPANIMLKGTWCPTCAGVSKISIEEFRFIAESYGGKCLSQNYKNQQEKLEFICKNNHNWFAAAKHIKAGHWCAKCHIHFSEEICREIFQTIFETSFNKSRPPWLINRQGYQLELDGMSEDLGIAFEHQGKQHYGIDIFNVGIEGLRRIKDNDIIKRRLCKQNNIKLIEIPQLFELTKAEDLSNYLINKFSKYEIVNYSLEKLLKIKISRKNFKMKG